MPESPHASGKVFLVGAGPGDPGLLTLRGAALLSEADLVLYDYLVNPAVLKHAAPRAETVCLGQHGRGRILAPREVIERMIAAARAGQRVVRLKCGDPLVFARASEECAALRAASIPFEIVPGITAALAAGAYAGIPLTDRDASSALALVTGHESDDKQGAAIDYGSLATFPGTLIFYMGVTTADEWTRALIDRGKPASTPAAIVRRCSWSDQLTLHCTLGQVSQTIAAHKLRPPAIVVVGDVAAAEPVASWFTDRPLFGQRVLVTRPADQAEDLRRRLEEVGAEVIVQPAIAIGPPADWTPVDDAIARLEEFDWLVFSSAHGVRYFLDRIEFTGGDLRRLAGIRLAAIGTATAEELTRYHLRADLVPTEFRAEALAASLAVAGRGERFLLLRASRGREVLADELAPSAAVVEQVVVYSSTDVTEPDPAIAELLSSGKLAWITVTSSAIARSLVAMFGDRLQAAKLASISPVTSSTLRGLGIQPAVEAREYTMAGVVAAIVDASGR